MHETAAQILIVDDDDLLRDLLQFRLESAGYAVAVATDGGRGLEQARRLRPDLIILDSMLPVQSGPEVLRELKRDPACASIPVIILTARKGQADIVEALRTGAADYLTKPFLPEEMVARVAANLSRAALDHARPNAA